jgi:hypothetical protein
MMILGDSVGQYLDQRHKRISMKTEIQETSDRKLQLDSIGEVFKNGDVSASSGHALLLCSARSLFTTDTISLDTDRFFQTRYRPINLRPPFTFIVILYLEVSGGLSWHDVQEQLEDEYWKTLVNNWKLWISATVINIACVLRRVDFKKKSQISIRHPGLEYVTKNPRAS